MRAYFNTPCYYQRAERGTVGKGTCEAAARLEVPATASAAFTTTPLQPFTSPFCTSIVNNDFNSIILNSSLLVYFSNGLY
jgi:hypothetical protein